MPAVIKKTALEKLLEILEKEGVPMSAPELTEKSGYSSQRTVISNLQPLAEDGESYVRGRRLPGKLAPWIFWLEPSGEEEEEEERREFHNDLTEKGEGNPLICNVCGKEFQAGQTCYSVDKIKMVDQEEGKMQAIIQVCEKCFPKKLKKASWDIV